MASENCLSKLENILGWVEDFLAFKKWKGDIQRKLFFLREKVSRMNARVNRLEGKCSDFLSEVEQGLEQNEKAFSKSIRQYERAREELRGIVSEIDCCIEHLQNCESTLMDFEAEKVEVVRQLSEVMELVRGVFVDNFAHKSICCNGECNGGGLYFVESAERLYHKILSHGVL